MRHTALAFLIAIAVMLVLLYWFPKPCYPVNLDDEGIEVGEPIEIHWMEV